jgi:hypothetical protein
VTKNDITLEPPTNPTTISKTEKGPGWKRDILILAILQVALGSIYLKTVPRLYTDEVWDSSLGYSLAYFGELRHQFIEGFGGMHIHFVQPRVILPLVCAIIFKIAGFSILASRTGSLIFSVSAVVSLYALMRRWFGEKQAVCIVIATILHPWFFTASRTTRPEIYCLALSVATLWCMVYSFNASSWWAALLAGIFAALASLAHPLGLMIDAAVVASVVIWMRNRKIWRLALWGCFGFIVVILPYIVYVLWSIQNPEVNFFEQMHSGWGQRSTLTAGEIRRWKNFLQWPKGGPLAIIMVVSWLLAWYRSPSEDKILANIIGLYVLILPFASTNTAGRYLVPVVPLFCALMTRAVWRVMTGQIVILWNWSKLRFIVGAGVAVIYVSMCITAVSLMIYRLRGADFEKVIARVASTVGRESSVYGEGIFWLGRNHYRYGPYPVDASAVPLRQTVDMIRKHRFDYAIRAAWSFASSYSVASPPAAMPDFRPSLTIDQVCERFGTKVDEFRDPYFGPIEIYKLNWDNNSDPKGT